MAIWDVEVGTRIKRLKGHTSFVNTCSAARRGPQLICSGSDDGTIKVSIQYRQSRLCHNNQGQNLG